MTRHGIFSHVLLYDIARKAKQVRVPNFIRLVITDVCINRDRISDINNIVIIATLCRREIHNIRY